MNLKKNDSICYPKLYHEYQLICHPSVHHDDTISVSLNLYQVYESGIKELQLLKEQLEAENGDGVDESTALASGSQVEVLPFSSKSKLYLYLYDEKTFQVRNIDFVIMRFSRQIATADVLSL